MDKSNDTADRELALSRLLDAPVDLVWEVWTDPEHIKNWWGPDGFTNTIDLMEIKTGGRWHLTMHGPDGVDYINKSVFREIIPLKKIVYQHISSPAFVSTIELEAQGDKTLLKWHMLFDTKDEFERVVRTFKADEGLKQNVEKLGRYLQAQIGQ